MWSCCSSASPCTFNEGDCDTNEDCIGDLVCGISNCIGSKYPPNVDCCTSESKGTKLALSNLVGLISIFVPEITFDCINIQNIPKHH